MKVRRASGLGPPRGIQSCINCWPALAAIREFKADVAGTHAAWGKRLEYNSNTKGEKNLPFRGGMRFRVYRPRRRRAAYRPCVAGPGTRRTAGAPAGPVQKRRRGSVTRGVSSGRPAKATAGSVRRERFAGGTALPWSECAGLSATSGSGPPARSSWTRCAEWSTAGTTRRASRWSAMTVG